MTSVALVMGYSRIVQKVYREPWLIKPSVHHSIQASLNAHINGESVSGYEEEEEMDFHDGATAIIPISGILGKHLSLFETTCIGGVDCDSISLYLDAAVMDESQCLSVPLDCNKCWFSRTLSRLYLCSLMAYNLLLLNK